MLRFSVKNLFWKFSLIQNSLCFASLRSFPALNTLYELAANINTPILIRFLFKFADICLDALMLSRSRIVRRSAALLSRALFTRALDDFGNGQGALCVEFCRGAREDKLREAVFASASGGWGSTDREAKRNIGNDALGSGGRLYDEAVKMRSVEALSAWEELENVGAWKLARAKVASDAAAKNCEGVAVVKRLLKEPLSTEEGLAAKLGGVKLSNK